MSQNEQCTDSGSSSTPANSIVNFSLGLASAIQAFEEYFTVPFYHVLFEVLLIVWIMWLLMHKSYKPKEQRIKLTPEEEDALIAEYQPEPLVPLKKSVNVDEEKYVVEGKSGTKMMVNGKEVLNFSTFNFLGLVGCQKVEDAAVQSMRKYGVGTCGPRGFYGTIDVHLDLEKKIAEFLQTEESILYSYGFSTISSAIPAYSKRTDVLFCDDGVSFAVQKGVEASRSKVYWFKHNDMADLELKMKEQEQRDVRNRKKAKVTRRFLIVEGLYQNHGDIAPLPQLVKLKHKYKVRLFIDESMSFGVLGKSGRGISEHFDIAIREIDLIAVSLETSLASVGGFCAGSSFVIDHQRLSGQGYCFSASLPPLLTASAYAGLEIIKSSPEKLTDLSNNAVLMRSLLKENEYLEIGGVECSPIIHIKLNQLALKSTNEDRQTIEIQLQNIVKYCFERGVALTRSKYITQEEHALPSPTIRLTTSCEMKSEDITLAAKLIQEACSHLFGTK